MSWSVRRHLVISLIVAVLIAVPVIVYEGLNYGADVRDLLLVGGGVAVLATLNGIADYRRAEWVRRREQTKR